MTVVLTSLLLFPFFGTSEADTGCISGRIWHNGEQTIDYSVTLEPGNITVEADSNGVYCFSELVPGKYIVSTRSDSIEVVAGDTTFADKAANSWDWWEEISENYQYELLFRLVSKEPVSPYGFIIYGSMRGLNRLPVRILKDSIIAVKTPAGSFSFIWSLPGTPEQHVVLRDCPSIRQDVNELYLSSEFDPPWSDELQFLQHIDLSDYPLAAADTAMYEWCSDDIEITHHVFNPRAPDNVLRCLDAGIAYPEDSDWCMWAAYTDKIVTMDSHGRIRSCDIPEPVCNASISPFACRAVVIVREPRGSRYSFGWYRVNLETGEVFEFEPFPDTELDNGRPSLAGFETNAPQARVYPADDGSILIRVQSELLYTYTPDGVLEHEYSFLNTDFRELRISGNNMRWLVFKVIGFEEPVYTVGNIYSNMLLSSEHINLGPYASSVLSPSGRYIALWGRQNGFWLYDLQEDSLTELLSTGRVGYRSVRFSEDESLVACQLLNSYIVSNSEARAETVLFDLTAGAADTCIMRFPCYSLVYQGSPLALSNRGWVPMKLTERGSRYSDYRFRAALLNGEGRLLWVGHYLETNRHFFSLYQLWGQFSPDGSLCAFSDGDQIHLLTIGVEE